MGPWKESRAIAQTRNNENEKMQSHFIPLANHVNHTLFIPGKTLGIGANDAVTFSKVLHPFVMLDLG